MDANVDYEDTYDEPEPDVDEADVTDKAPKKRNPLRLILLVLVVLILLCVVCWLGSSLLGGALDPIRGLLPGGDGGATVVVDTPVPPVTEEPAGEPVEPAPTDEGMLPTEEPATPPGVPEATQEPPTEPTEESGEPPATTEPVPGPTSTPTLESAPTIVITPSNCEGNVPPVAVANGPYNGMMGKGQAFVTFDATGSVDSDGTIVEFEWDFGDQSEPGYGPIVTHGYTNPGSYVAILTVTDNCSATGQDTAEVLISGPTPPAETVTPDPNLTPTVSPTPNNITLGFCYIVHYGDTLSGIAWYYGLSLQDLAYVNNVSTDYYVKAGEGLFIPYGPIVEGANGYQVQYGDTIQTIAYQCAVPPSAVAEANGIPADSALTPGDVIIIPLGRY